MATEGPVIGSLRDSVTHSVRALIVSGNLRPGTRLVERRLAENLGVSRVPVREALQALAREGFVEERPAGGLAVRRLGHDDFEMLFAVRSALEGLLALRLVDLLDADGLALLQEVVDRSSRLSATGLAEDAQAAIAANAEFHAVLVALADSDELTSIMEPLSGRMAWLLSQHSDPVTMNAEHQQIVDALRTRDPEAVKQVLQHHLDGSRTTALAALGSTESEHGKPALTGPIRE